VNTVWSDEAGPPKAPLIVLIHGTMDRSTGMLKLSRRLDFGYRVMRYDRRGYGRSTPHDGPFHMAAQVDDLVTLLCGRAAVLVGHSYGGNVALAMASRYPDLVRGVAIYETPLSWEPWWPGTTAGAAARATQGDAAEAAERFMRRLIGDANWERLPERTRATRRTEGAAMVGELRDLQANQPWHANNIHCPVVLGHGSQGAEHHRDGMRYVHDRLPQSALVELAGCRHDAPLSHSELFTTMLIDPLLRAVGGAWSAAINVRAGAP
jgi:pimeloyl-ACP methyl ester carboxylesterase